MTNDEYVSRATSSTRANGVYLVLQFLGDFVEEDDHHNDADRKSDDERDQQPA